MRTKSPDINLIKTALITCGGTTIIAQIVLMRELLVIFYGNELSMGIMLAVWLFWSAIGSGVIGRCLARKNITEKIFAALLAATSLIFPATLFANRISLRLFHHTPGAITGLDSILFIPAITLSLLCTISGILFTLGCRLYSNLTADKTATVGTVYLLEVIGASAGGLAASFMLIKFFTSFQIAAFTGAFSLTVSTVLLMNRQFQLRLKALILPTSVFFIALLIFFQGFTWLEGEARKKFWQGHSIIKIENSIYGTLAVSELEQSFSFFENGLLMYTVPDLFYAEESIHFALLQHPNPERVLLIGGGAGGGLKEILKYPAIKTIDYVELDPTLIHLAREILPQTETDVFQHPRVHLHFIDGRRFIKLNPQKYDVIIANIPAPSSTQLNRFYTHEFYQALKTRLAKSGIFAFHVLSAENYISEPLRQFLSCLYFTLQQSFKDIVVIPGNTNHFICSPAAGTLTADADLLIERLQQQGIQNEFVNEFYLPFRMSPERMAYLESRLQETPNEIINRDFKPIAYLFDMILWSSYTSEKFRDAFSYLAQHKFRFISWLLLLLSVTIFTSFWGSNWKKRGLNSSIVTAVGLVGFTEIGLEFSLILAFQALFGYAYYQVALMVTGYMLGLALGSWVATQRLNHRIRIFREFLAIQVFMIFYPLLLGVILFLQTVIQSYYFSDFLIEIIFMILVAGAGFIGGYHFPLAGEMKMRAGASPAAAGGTMYAFDLLGSCLGALVTSSFLIPLFGIYQTFLFYSLLNLFALLLLISAYRLNAGMPSSTQSTRLPG